ncbi:flagellar hook-associated protein 2 [Sporosarcina sp. PTS2304]|uniref:flagellar hook-associated protein 2 n=1 Tax=Sporosarcina sp. PTS2304 TaxID=2283194 RepID=UPI000E0D0851|nr:flagellar hook-associated protein 2 [Sporosarcina sp. PTS2304]AXH98476.1 flagellar hook-associated protein 2 [Sporosarcina sp. PTS2304]
MRIGGIVSGMDTESIIRDMMKAHRLPLDKITQKKQYTQWMLDDYRSTNRDLRKSGDKLFDTVMKQGTYLQKNVTVSDEKAASITSKTSASDFSGTLEIEQLASQATFQSGSLTTGTPAATITDDEAKTKTLAELNIFTSTEGQTLTITAPGKEAREITIKSTDTLNSVLDQINEKTGVSAFYDSGTGKIAMSAKDSGAGEITIAGTGTIAQDLKLDASASGTAKSVEGTDAKFTFNGLETTRSSNTFTINGFEVSLKAKTTAPVTFSSSTNVDKIVDSVTQFVNDYNEMIEKLNGKVKEKQFKSFHPLSDAEKADMKEKEIELWEEKAKSGTMRNDPALSTMLSNLRTIMSKAVETTDKDGNKINISLKDLGIETTKNYLDNGKLTINEDKLREKIAENPNAVYDLIGRGNDDPKKAGIAHEYRNELTTAQKKISEKAGSSTALNDSFALGRSMKSMDKQIARFEQRLEMMENRYWKQFNAMETAIQRANAQSAQLMSSLGGGM